MGSGVHPAFTDVQPVRYSMQLMRKLAVAISSLLFLPIVATAQVGPVPPQLLDQSRPLQGNMIRACVDESSAGGALDRAVAQAIGDALFLEVKFVPALRGFPINGEGYLQELQVHLNNDCDLFMGIAVQPNSPFPDWALVTRAYARIPFVLATTELGFERLADIPRDRMIGTALASLGEQVFITTMMQRPENQRWKRLPYADFELMLKRMREGRLAAMLLWQPALAQLLADDPEADSIRLIATDPVPTADVRVGALINVRNNYLRSQVDAAIAELVADGTIDQIMEDLGLVGTAGG